MGNFDLQAWKTAKLAELETTIDNSSSDLANSETIKNEAKVALTAVLNKIQASTLDEAERLLKSQTGGKIGGFINEAGFFIDTISNTVELNKFPVDTSGSSIDDGNDKLYWTIDKDTSWYFCKSIIAEGIVS